MARRLYRSSRQRVLTGVCGGLADYLDIDPLLVRIIFLVLAVSGGLGILLYLAAWIIIPAAPADEIPQPEREMIPNTKRNPSGMVFGTMVIILGIGLLLHNYGLFHLPSGLIWPLVLIAVGVRLLIRNKP